MAGFLAVGETGNTRVRCARATASCACSRASSMTVPGPARCQNKYDSDEKIATS